jgi:hypothetical protein
MEGVNKLNMVTWPSLLIKLSVEWCVIINFYITIAKNIYHFGYYPGRTYISLCVVFSCLEIEKLWWMGYGSE